MIAVQKPRILILCDFYLPGYKSGGSMRTVVNMVERLGRDFEFFVITRDHDGKTDKTPYTGVKINEWNEVGSAQVMYLSRDRIKLGHLKRSIDELDPDSIYLNSYFSTLTVYSLILRKLGRIKHLPIIIAPEGELAQSARHVKSAKKRAFLKGSSAIGLYDNLIWKLASEFEVAETEGFAGANGKQFIAPNMPPRSILPDYRQTDKPNKAPDRVRLAYLSRIHPIKNLNFLLELLKEVDGNVELDVFGPNDATDYYESCLVTAARLPANIAVTFRGEVEHQHVVKTLVDSHFFVLPTQGENFGHVFIEALSAGCPLITSDRTPWIGLEEKGIGWDIPLTDRERWIRMITQCVKMDNDTYSRFSENARNYSERSLEDKEVENATRRVLKHSIEIASNRVSDNSVKAS